MSSLQQPPEAQETAQTAPPAAPFMMPSGQMSTPAGYQPYAYAAPSPMAFTPYPTPNQAFEMPKPAQNKAWEITKVVFHTLSVILAVVGIGLGFSTLHYFYFSYTVVIGAAPPCIIAFLWSLVELIVRAARKFKAGIPPGAHIALSLIIFLVGVILTSLFGPWFQSSWYSDSESDSQNCTYQYSSTLDTYTYVCSDDGATDDADARRQFVHERSVAYAAAIVTYIISIIHFALFVGACVDTSKVNAAASRPIYVIAQPQMMQGWQPIQQAPAEPFARDMPPTESEGQSRSEGKGKEPARNDDIVEHYAPGGSQA